MKYSTFRNLLLAGGVLAVLGGGASLYACSRGTSGSSASGLPPASASTTSNATPSAPSTTVANSAVSAPTATQAPAASGTPSAGSAANGGALRTVDKDILAWRKTASITGDKVKDVFPGKPYKVDAYKDEGKSGVNRVKVDLDRDGKWDEKWDFDGEKVKRKVSPGDDESYSQEFRLDGEAWRPKN